MKVSGVRGFRDILPPESERWEALEEKARSVLRSYNFAEIRLPVLERTELFARSLGEDTDIVAKEMYTFQDRDGASLALRPEGTASIVRAYLEGGLAASAGVVKFFYLGPMFRRERPQKGRLRQFHQLGVEVIGRDDPASDAEVITLLEDLLRAAGARAFRLEINSVGDAACRPFYREALKKYAAGVRDRLCADCQSRIERNPMRLLDCKKESCRLALAEAPSIQTYLCGDCRAHFERVLALLEEAQASVSVNARLVRGLDYYTRTVFEALAPGLGAQNAVGGGGRYDGLVAKFGGPPKPAIGFALGLERLVMIGAAADEQKSGPRTAVIALVEEAEGRALALARRLRSAGVVCEVEGAGASLKSRMRRADRGGATFVLLIGEDELREGRATVRDMRGRRDYSMALRLEANGKELRRLLEELAHG